MYVSAHHTKRLIMALQYEGEDRDRSLMASDLTWRTLDSVPGHTLRWLVAVFVQDGKSPEGWKQWTTQPGEEGARQSVILSLLVDHCLGLHPDQLAQLTNNLPAYTVGSLRARVPVECRVDVSQKLVSSDDAHGQRPRFTHALHEMFALGRAKKPLIQRHLGRLEPTPSLKYRAEAVLRNLPVLST